MGKGGLVEKLESKNKVVIEDTQICSNFLILGKQESP